MPFRPSIFDLRFHTYLGIGTIDGWLDSSSPERMTDGTYILGITSCERELTSHISLMCLNTRTICLLVPQIHVGHRHIHGSMPSLELSRTLQFEVLLHFEVQSEDAIGLRGQSQQ